VDNRPVGRGTCVPFTVSRAVKGTLDAEMPDACTVDGKHEHDRRGQVNEGNQRLSRNLRVNHAS
jgi:hypothetical protein